MIKRRFLFLLLSSVLLSGTAGADIITSIEKRVEAFQGRYGIDLVFEDPMMPGGDVVFKPIAWHEYGTLNQYLAMFEEEIAKYPPNFFKDREVRAIVLVTRLFSKEKPAQGIYSAFSRVMFFDVLRFSDNKALKRHSIHHELFHMMALQTPGYRFEDEAWAQLNPEGFVYGAQIFDAEMKNPYNELAPAWAGFATDYAMTSVEEDKAEVFACLMQAAHQKIINRWSEKDEILRQKIRIIKDFVADHSPEMNEEYWTSIIAAPAVNVR